MTATYSRVYHRIWSNKEFRNANPDARFAALYLLSCPHRNTEGLFRLPIPFAMFDLQWDQQRTETAFAALETMGFIERDEDNDLVLLVNALKWQPPAGTPRIKGAVNAMSELPDSPLNSRFLGIADELCPELAERLRDGLGWVTDTVPKRSRDGIEAVSGPSRDGPEYSSSSSSSSSNSSCNSTTTTSQPKSEPVGNGGGGKLNTTNAALNACRKRGWTDAEIGQRLDGIAGNPTILNPEAVALTRLRAMASETPPGTIDECGTCHGNAMILVEDGATQCTQCNGQGTTPRTHRTDQGTF